MGILLFVMLSHALYKVKLDVDIALEQLTIHINIIHKVDFTSEYY